MSSQTFTYPTGPGLAYIPESVEWAVEDAVFLSRPPLGGRPRTVEIPGGWLVATITYPVQSQEERAELFGWLSKAGARRNRVAMHHFALPVPRGSMRGSPVVKFAAGVGAESVVVMAMNGNLRRGDIIGLTDGPHVVVDDANPVGNEATVNIAPQVRATVAANSAVLWDRPTGLFIATAVPRVPFRGAGGHPSFSVSFVEVGA